MSVLENILKPPLNLFEGLVLIIFFRSCRINWCYGCFQVFKTITTKFYYNWQFYERCIFITNLQRIFNKWHTLGNCSSFKTFLNVFNMIFLIVKISYSVHGSTLPQLSWPILLIWLTITLCRCLSSRQDWITQHSV